MLDKMQSSLMEKVQKQLIAPKVFLNKLQFTTDLKSKYQDNFWLPFWYYLGEEIRPKSLLDVGSEVGLESSCCILGGKLKTITSLYEVKSRFTSKNIKLSGGVLESQDNYEFGIVNGEFLDHLPSIWDRIKLGGLLCVMNVKKEAISDFAKINNRTPIFFELRHCVGLLQK